jgi:hypothetical protein
MSNQTRRVSSKSATKRRAVARRRTREIGRQFFAYFIIGILVLGTISSVVFTPTVGTAPTSGALTPTLGTSQFDALITQGDQAVAAGKPDEAVGYYGAYLGQNPGSPEVNLKLAKAYIASSPPKYNEASQVLSRVITIDPAGSSGPYASEATNLLVQIKDKVTPISSVVPGQAVITGTQSIVVPDTTMTASQPITK